MRLIITFRSRAQTLKLHSQLRRYGYESEIITTPPSITKSCSLSVATNESVLTGVESLIRRLGLNTFVGVFREEDGQEIYKRIYLR